LTWHQPGILLIREEIRSDRPVEATSRGHLHPECAVVRQDKSGALLASAGGPVCVQFAGPGELRIERGSYCPEFGLRHATSVLAWSAPQPGERFGFCIAPFEGITGFDLERGATVAGRDYGF
jgi:hypothetical protein